MNTFVDSINTEETDWSAAAIAGIVATVAFGILRHATGSAGVIRAAFPAMYGLGLSLAVGRVVHLFHGAVLGLVYAVIVSVAPSGNTPDRPAVASSLGWCTAS